MPPLVVLPTVTPFAAGLPYLLRLREAFARATLSNQRKKLPPWAKTLPMYWFGRPIPAKYVALVSSGWGKPRPGGEHHAIDIVGKTGTPILAVADGIVVRAQRDITGPSGRYVTLFHSRGVHTRYMHLDGLRRGLKVGDRVNLGDVIGFLGNTGRSSTPHLHFDIHVPPMMLPEIAVAVGRPTTGWGDQDALGVAIPAEPWLPVDKYRDDVVRTAAALGIPLWRSIFNLPMV